MPRPICSKCKCDMHPHVTGVRVVIVARWGPYQLWYADEFYCPICHNRVVINFADRPTAINGQAKFMEILRDWVEHEGDTLRFSFEDTHQAPLYNLRKELGLEDAND